MRPHHVAPGEHARPLHPDDHLVHEAPVVLPGLHHERPPHVGLPLVDRGPVFEVGKRDAQEVREERLRCLVVVVPVLVARLVSLGPCAPCLLVVAVRVR